MELFARGPRRHCDSLTIAVTVAAASITKGIVMPSLVVRAPRVSRGRREGPPFAQIGAPFAKGASFAKGLREGPRLRSPGCRWMANRADFRRMKGDILDELERHRRRRQVSVDLVTAGGGPGSQAGDTESVAASGARFARITSVDLPGLVARAVSVTQATGAARAA